MKYFPSLLTLLTVSFCFAQPADLYVSDNAASYIYVDGAAFNNIAGTAPLYVSNDIDLAGTNSFIYLRNEAQLLQGTNINNSGTGQLSVYQRGTVSEFNYNYWCSPVGNTSANDNTNRNFVPNNNLYGRDLTSASPEITSLLANYTTGYDGTAGPPLTISSRWLYTYSPGGTYSDWDPLGQAGTTALPGYGFTMKGVSGTDGDNNPAPVGNNQLYDFRGKPNSGDIVVPVLAPVAGVPQFTLTGNPYPSALDARDFFHLDSENQVALGGSGALLFWEQFSSSHTLADYIGGYGLYTISAAGVVSYTAAPWLTYDSAGNEVGFTPGGPSPNNTPGVNAPGRYLPVGQGFMVEGATDNNIYFRNTYREFWKESFGNSHFFRNSDDSSSDENAIRLDNGNVLPDDYMRFRIKFDIQHNSEFFSRELLVNMVDYATDDYDYGMEAKLPEIMPSDAHFLCNNVPFGILAVPFSMDKVIPITVKIHQKQDVRFRTYALQNFPETLPVYLHDIDNQLYVNLRVQDYEINLDPGTYSNRFEITFEDQSLSTPEVTIDDFKIFQNNPQSQLTIINPNGFDVKNVKMFDTSGKQIFDAGNLTNEAEYHFTTKTLSEGIYVATITLGTNEVVSKKVIVKN